MAIFQIAILYHKDMFIIHISNELRIFTTRWCHFFWVKREVVMIFVWMWWIFQVVFDNVCFQRIIFIWRAVKCINIIEQNLDLLLWWIIEFVKLFLWIYFTLLRLERSHARNRQVIDTCHTACETDEGLKRLLTPKKWGLFQMSVDAFFFFCYDSKPISSYDNPTGACTNIIGLWPLSWFSIHAILLLIRLLKIPLEPVKTV